MPRAHANGMELEYETLGDPSAPPVVLIMGLSCQLLLWPDGFCRQLADRGYYVVRFDNRDIGMSSASTDAYLLADMAADTIGLMDALDIAAAHIVGQSMGGMIAQTIAIDYATRVRSLASISSTTGDTSVGQPHPELLGELMAGGPRPEDREAAAEAHVRLWRLLASSAWPFDEDGVRERGRRVFDRERHPMGLLKQLQAITNSPDRTPGLAHVPVPTLVIHGDIDPLVDVSGGEATAKAVPGSDLIIVPGMGHDIPEGAWPMLVDALVTNFEKAGST
jgi:pimeloyl-ACP methyl ester carboxylesterase